MVRTPAAATRVPQNAQLFRSNAVPPILAAGYASQNLGLKLRLANDREHRCRLTAPAGDCLGEVDKNWPIGSLAAGSRREAMFRTPLTRHGVT